MTASAFNYYLYVGEGKKRSENLKKRYSKKKNNLKRKSASGPGLADVEAAKRDLKEYGFLSWPEKYLQLSETKTNLRSFRLDDFESGSTDHSDPDDTESLNIELDLNRASKKKKMKTTPICTKVSDDKTNSNSSNSKKKLKLFNKLNCLFYKVLEMLLLQTRSLHPLTTRKMLMTCLVKWFHRN